MTESFFSDIPVGTIFRLRNAPTVAKQKVEWTKIEPVIEDGKIIYNIQSGDRLSRIGHNAMCRLQPYDKNPLTLQGRARQGTRTARLKWAAQIKGFSTVDEWARATIEEHEQSLRIDVE